MQSVISLTKKLTSYIKYILGFATWILSILSTFINPPPAISVHINPTAVKGIANLLLAITAVSFLFSYKIKTTKGQRSTAIILSWILLVVGICIFYSYNKFLDEKTTEWPLGSQNYIVVGNSFTDSAKVLLTERKYNISKIKKEDVIKVFAPHTLEDLAFIWPDDEIQSNGIKIVVLYFFSIAIFCSLLFLLTYSIQIKDTR